MSGTTPGTGGSHYNPDEPRDWHGRWTTGGSSWRDTPLRDPSAAGRARTLLGHARVGAWQKGVLSDVAWPTPAEAARFSRLLTAWNAASGLDDAPFAEWFTRGLDIGPATRDRLRQAAAGAAQARTIAQMIEASIPLTAAIKDIGGDRWPGMLKRLEDLADAAMPKVSGRVTVAPPSAIVGSGGSTRWPLGRTGLERPGIEPCMGQLPRLTMWAFRALLRDKSGRKPPPTPPNPLTEEEIKWIQDMPKGSRPDPSSYLPQEYSEEMLRQFDNGATRFMLRRQFDKYGIGNVDGTSFVMPREEADRLLEATKGDPRALEQALGLEPGSLDNDELLRIDIPKPRNYGLRIPSGNEGGTNEFWIPGGKLPDGETEAVIDGGKVPPKAMKVSPFQPANQLGQPM